MSRDFWKAERIREAMAPRWVIETEAGKATIHLLETRMIDIDFETKQALEAPRWFARGIS
jgi:hypothetical protein